MQIVRIKDCYYLQYSSWGDTNRFYNKYAGSLEFCLKKMHKAMRKFIYDHPELIEKSKMIC